MRFALAAGILANTLPSNFQSNGLVEAREDRRALWRSLAVIPPSDRVAAAKEALTNRQRRMNGGMLKNFAAERVAPSKACDPDIGLLACGSGEYCDGSHDSSLGGVCVPFPEEIERVLKENVTISGPGVYCDPSSPHYGGLNCTCNDWLAQNNTGTIHCSLVADACFKGCNTTCYAIDFTYFSDGSDISYQYCYDFIRPINQSFCFGYKNDQTCLLSLDGDMCSSCNTTYRLDCTTGKCYSQPCANFDCNNIGLSTGNSCYNTVVPPAFEKCYQQLNGLYPSCSLCPTNGILYPGAEFTLPGYGLFNCSYLESFATSGALNPQQCTYAQSLANSICCEKANQSVYVCNLCGGDGYVMTKPDAIVYIPSQPSVSCGNLQQVADQGVIQASQCSIVQGFTQQTCGCVKGNGTAPPSSSNGGSSPSGISSTPSSGSTVVSAAGAYKLSTLTTLFVAGATMVLTFLTK